jgi:tetratricopeptide (TPR) repeat protein
VRDGTLCRQLEPRAMDVLVALCKRAGRVVSAEELLEQCWGSTLYGDNPVHKTLTQLRRALGDRATEPAFIETIRKRGYRAIAEVSFADASGAPAPGSWVAGSPFRGLQAFDADHAAVFFGRAELTAALVQSLTRQVEAGRALQLVLGPSGSGKTSLICAGLLPALARGAGGLDVCDSAVIDLGELGDLDDGQLFTGLGGAMLDWQLGGAGLFDGYSAHRLGRLLESDPAAVAGVLERALGHAPGRARMTLVIDRFEAVFAQPHITAQQRDALAAALDTLARCGRVLLVLACRNDFYPRIAETPELLEGKANGAHVDLSPPSRAEIAQMIRLPALAANLSFATDPDSGERLDDMLCEAAAASPDALPLLQYALQELYRLRGPGGELGIDAYRRLGGLDGVLGVRAEDVVAGLGAAPRAALGRVLSLLLTISADDDRVTSRRAPWSALRSEAERELVGALVEARLFVSELVGAEAGFGIAHESLLRRWERVAQWIAEHRDSLRIRARVAQSTARWIERGRPADLLLPPGTQLDEARRMLAMPAMSLTAHEAELIRASRHKARLRERMRLFLFILISGLAVVATAAGISASRARQAAEHRRIEAEDLMGFMLGDFADKLRPSGRLDLLDGISAKAMGYLAGSGSEALNAASLTHRAKALQVISEVNIARGNPNAAYAALQAERTILQRQLQASPRSPALLKQSGANAFWLGKIRLDQGEWDDARRYLEQYRDDTDRLSAMAPNDVDAWIEQSYAHNSLGSLALKRGDARAAAAEFGLSIELKNKATVARPHDQMLAKDLADSMSWAGSANEVMGRLDKAQALYERQAQLAQGLLGAAHRDALWSNKLAEASQHLARIRLVQGDVQGAADLYRRAEALLRSNVAAAPDNRMWQESLAFVQLSRLRLPSAAGHLDGELAQLDELRKKFADLTQLDPKNTTWAKHEALALQQTASVLLAGGRATAASRMLDAAQSRLEQIHARNGSDILAKVMLANTWLARADIARASGDDALARQGCEHAGKLLAAQASDTEDFRILDPWARSQVCLSIRTTASAALGRLSRIGYREPLYMKYLSLHN